MKKLLFILVLSSITGSQLLAQSIEKKIVDKFTGAEYIGTSTEKLFKNTVSVGPLSASVLRTRDTTGTVLYGIIFSVYNKYGVVSVDNDCKVSVKMEGGTVITLPYTGQYQLISNTESFTYPALVSKEDLAMIAGGKVTDIRIGLTTGPVDYEIADSRQVLLPNMAKLILEK